jgi:hypothetical protein
MRKIILKCLVATAALAAMCGSAVAAEEVPGKDWYVALRLGYQPYQINAKGTALGRDFDKTASLSDIMDKTDTTIYGGELEFGKDKWFGTFAGFYQKSEVSRSNGTVGVDADFKETGLNPMVGYRVYQTRLGEMPLVVDAMAGLYYVKVEADVNIYDANVAHPLSKNISFTDPMLGTRGYLALTKKLGMAASWQIGGFGIGSDVNTTAAANVVYNFTNWIALSGGYKYWYFKYTDSGAPLSKLEQSLHGPVVGLQLKF